MKKLYLIFFILFSFIGKSFSQVGVVTDPGSYAYYAQQIEQATQTINVANKQFSILKEAKEKLEKFNEKLKSVSTFARAVDQSGRTVKTINDCISSIKSIDGVDMRVINHNVKKCIRLGERVNDNISDIKEILKSDNLNMSDRDRIDKVEEKLKDMREISSETDVLLRHIKQVKSMNRWVTKF